MVLLVWAAECLLLFFSIKRCSSSFDFFFLNSFSSPLLFSLFLFLLVPLDLVPLELSLSSPLTEWLVFPSLSLSRITKDLLALSRFSLFDPSLLDRLLLFSLWCFDLSGLSWREPLPSSLSRLLFFLERETFGLSSSTITRGTGGLFWDLGTAWTSRGWCFGFTCCACLATAVSPADSACEQRRFSKDLAQQQHQSHVLNTTSENLRLSSICNQGSTFLLLLFWWLPLA